MNINVHTLYYVISKNLYYLDNLCNKPFFYFYCLFKKHLFDFAFFKNDKASSESKWGLNARG